MVYAVIRYDSVSRNILGVGIRYVRSGIAQGAGELCLRCDNEENGLPDGMSIESFMNNFHHWMVTTDGGGLIKVSETSPGGRTYTNAEWNALTYSHLPLAYRRANEIKNFKFV